MLSLLLLWLYIFGAHVGIADVGHTVLQIRFELFFFVVIRMRVVLQTYYNQYQSVSQPRPSMGLVYLPTVTITIRKM